MFLKQKNEIVKQNKNFDEILLQILLCLKKISN